MTAATLFQRAQRYVGREYLLGEFDCADLAALVQRELFGREVGLPAHRRRPGGAMGQAREIRALGADVADLVDAPFTGCVVLMSEHGEPAPMWHVGTVFLHEGETWVLHNNFKLGSAALQRLPDLRRWGLKLDGYYAWKG